MSRTVHGARDRAHAHQLMGAGEQYRRQKPAFQADFSSIEHQPFRWSEPAVKPEDIDVKRNHRSLLPDTVISLRIPPHRRSVSTF